MKQCFVNYLRLFWRLSCVISLISFVNACNATSSQIPTNWRVGRIVEHITPQAQIALWTQNDVAGLVWAGAPDLPNLQFTVDDKPSLQLALGITPRLLSAVPLANHWTQLLWLDQTMPGDAQLIGGTVDDQGALQRGPTAISNATTVEYAAVPTTTGSTVVLWCTPTRSGPPTRMEIYLQLIDNVGRPLPAQRITADGRFPALAYDLHGTLHLLWLVSADGKQWTIHHSALPPTLDLTRAVIDDLTSSVIGAIKLTADQSIDSVNIVADSDSLYVMWSVATAGGATDVQGLSAPLDQLNAIRPFSVTLDGYQVRWPSLAAAPAEHQYLALVATNKDGQSVPILGRLTPVGVAELQPLAEATIIVSRVSLGSDVDEHLHLAWLRLEQNGESTLIYLTNQP